ncbi:cobyric acid synthase [uncultured Selenomonas sp.]|uniref:cobyric acid synthase n=1 Tax=uncultured Selenomonas sp. TaxID=159275 RepID=UPI0025E07CB8|nr:cobyric acid synthase [uncultured Selenomonas sp.]
MTKAISNHTNKTISTRPQTIMLMGTSSHVGKSILATALCRIFHQQGRRVVPFKAQNMALNSYVTKDGLEMGRAQVAQAEAAGLAPHVDMNPVLLKPTGNSCSQVIVDGKPIGNLSAREYHKGKSRQLFGHVTAALARLSAAYDTIVIEGAGSPAEINLKDDDIVNMRVAKYLQAPVLLIADIDRGGSLASLVGTLELLDEGERALVKGLIINKFRGDVTLMDTAVDFLEKKTGKPVLGIVPYIEKMGIDDEDSVSLADKEREQEKEGPKDLTLAVIETPKISNFTDFEALAEEPDVEIAYVKTAEELRALKPDAILLPGSKNTTEDLLHLRKEGIETAIADFVNAGTPLIGICGGYQMLGEKIADPHHTESGYDEVAGLGYLPMVTTFEEEKRTVQVTADCPGLEFLDGVLLGKGMPGYEIHMGRTEFTAPVRHPFHIVRQGDARVNLWDGALREDGRVFGTYLHGVFDHDGFRRQFLNVLRHQKGLDLLPIQRNRRREKEQAYDHLAGVVKGALDMKQLAKIMDDAAAAAAEAGSAAGATAGAGSTPEADA